MTTLAEDLVAAIDEVVPKGLPQQLREDVCQEMLVDILSKKFSIRNAHKHVKDYIRSEYKDSAQSRFLESLDRPVGDPDGDFTLLDTLDAPVVDEPFVIAPDSYAQPYKHERKRKGREPTGELLPCKQCGTPFYVTPHLFKAGARYCSKACFYEHGKGPDQSYPASNPCLHCGTLDYKVAGTRDKKYCSHQCALKAWHRQAALESRCHWCGKPSLPDYKSACAEHQKLVRITTKRSGEERRAWARAHGLCEVCRKEPHLTGFLTCADCRQNRITSGRRFRGRGRTLTARRRKRLGLVGRPEAAAAASIGVMTLHKWIKTGRVDIIERTGPSGHRHWVRLTDVLRVAEEMKDYKPPRGTHCRSGHPFSGDNLYVHAKTGARQCKTCNRAARQARVANWAKG